MNREEIRYKARQRRVREVARKRMLLLLVAVLLIVIGCIVFGSIFSSAQASATESGVEYKYYKSIVIEDGDTLWSIAKEYRTDAYSSTQEYIDELLELNDLNSDTIHAGQHLVIAYFDKEFR